MPKQPDNPTYRVVYGGCCMCGKVDFLPIINAYVTGFETPLHEELTAADLERMLEKGENTSKLLSIAACEGCAQAAMEMAAHNLQEELRGRMPDVVVKTVNLCKNAPN